MAAAPAIELPVGERTVRVTNPDRVYFPLTGATKRDLVEYTRSARASSTRCGSGRA
jgi:DNA primase